MTKLNNALTSFIRSSYYGGSSFDFLHAIAVDPSGDVYVTGTSKSLTLPGTSGGAQTVNNGGGGDALVARFNSSLTTVKSTFLGGSGLDLARAMALGGGDVYVAGLTTSTNLPHTAGGAQTTNAGGEDTFVSLLSGDLGTIIQSTYLGGSGGDSIRAMTMDSSGEVYVVGRTSSANLPGTAGGSQPTSGGKADAFAAKLSGNLVTLIQATYVGGSGSDYGQAVALGSSGTVYVAGYTNSKNLPGAKGGAQPSTGGLYDAYVSELPGTLT